jgi:hypothetical protein
VTLWLLAVMGEQVLLLLRTNLLKIRPEKALKQMTWCSKSQMTRHLEDLQNFQNSQDFRTYSLSIS